jgi:hypothetical protein
VIHVNKASKVVEPTSCVGSCILHIFRIYLHKICSHLGWVASRDWVVFNITLYHLYDQNFILQMIVMILRQNNTRLMSEIVLKYSLLFTLSNKIYLYKNII